MVTWRPGVTLEQIELGVCAAAYAYFKQNKQQTAASLGISVRTLETKMDALGKRAESEEQRRQRAKEEMERELQYARHGGRPQPVPPQEMTVADVIKKEPEWPSPPAPEKRYQTPAPAVAAKTAARK